MGPTALGARNSSTTWPIAESEELSASACSVLNSQYEQKCRGFLLPTGSQRPLQRFERSHPPLQLFHSLTLPIGGLINLKWKGHVSSSSVVSGPAFFWILRDSLLSRY